MIYEMRIYDHAEGRAEDVRERFRDEVAPRFSKHGIDLVAAFVEPDTDRLVYLTRFPDEEARKRGWESFKGDQEWLAAKAESERDGPMVVKQHATVLMPAMSDLLLN